MSNRDVSPADKPKRFESMAEYITVNKKVIVEAEELKSLVEDERPKEVGYGGIMDPTQLKGLFWRPNLKTLAYVDKDGNLALVPLKKDSLPENLNDFGGLNGFNFDKLRSELVQFGFYDQDHYNMTPQNPTKPEDFIHNAIMKTLQAIAMRKIQEQPSEDQVKEAQEQEEQLKQKQEEEIRLREARDNFKL